MTLLIISDTHGRAGFALHKLLELNKNIDSLLFLGDGANDLRYLDLGGRGLLKVRGNCDMFSDYADDLPEELFVTFGEYNILMMHGHKYSVKSGVSHAAEYAAKKGADILLFGHTHMPYEAYYAEGEQIGSHTLSKPLRVFNPGSLGEPRGESPSFGVIEIRKGSVLLSHGTI